MATTPNPERTARTRAALIRAARTFFATEAGYAGASTPAIADAAGVSRGALYHHFATKELLFREVVEAEMLDVALAIERASTDQAPIAALQTGTDAFLDAMRDPGRRRILLIDGPALLGTETMRKLDKLHAGRTLAEGIEIAIAAGDLPAVAPSALADLISAAMDRAAEHADDPEYRHAIATLIDLLATPHQQSS